MCDISIKRNYYKVKLLLGETGYGKGLWIVDDTKKTGKDEPKGAPQ